MRAPPLGQAAVLAALLSLSSCLTGSHLCPRSLDCARAGRHFCQPGGSHCGPCLHPLVEDSRGRCVVKRRYSSHSTPSFNGKTSNYLELDEQIDFLSAVISEQRTRLPAPLSQDESAPKSEQRGGSGYTLGATTAVPPTTQSLLPTSLAPPNASANSTPALLSGPVILPDPPNDQIFIIMSSVFIVAGSLALIITGACWVRLQKSVRLTQKVDYPAYGLMKAQTFDNVPGDKGLVHSAQMFHYQHQKQQMLSLEKKLEKQKVPDSGASTDEENEDGEFTVYECPGLAPTGEMEVKNPLFDDSTLYLQRFHK